MSALFRWRALAVGLLVIQSQMLLRWDLTWAQALAVLAVTGAYSLATNIASEIAEERRT